MNAPKNDSLQSIPEESLESIVGGVLDEQVRQGIKRYALDLKEGGVSLDKVLAAWKAIFEPRMNPADRPECEQIIRSVYEE